MNLRTEILGQPHITELGREAIRRFASAVQALGRVEKQAVEQRIRDLKRTDGGTPWATWRPSTRRARIRKGNAHQGLLWDSGLLLQSVYSRITSRGPGRKTLHIGVSGPAARYGRYLQHGTESMVARPFLPSPIRVQRRLIDLLRNRA